MINRPLYIDKVKPYIDTPFVKILSGIRRCGKSTILKMIAREIRERGVPEKRIITYNFDSLEFDEIKTAKHLYEAVKKQLPPEGRSYIFLDEIQEIESWEKAVNSIMTDFNVDVYVTGSNSRMLSSEISTYLTGRYISINVYPLSFREYLSFRKEYTAIHDERAELARYLRFGGFPAIHLREYSTDEAYVIIRDIYNSVIFTDIVKRNEIRKIDQLERIVKFLFENAGRTFSAASIAKYLKSQRRAIDNETVYSYIKKLESAFILHRCPRYDIQGKEILKTQEKYYLCDPAFRYCLLGYAPDTVAAMLENLVCLELLRRDYKVNVGKTGNAEIDFIAAKTGNVLYIQVTERIESAETEKREYDRLLGIKDNYPKYVLRTDEFADGNYQGIKTRHIADFLLSDEY
jgi:hypothetical protein